MNPRDRSVVLWTLGILSVPAIAVLAVSATWTPEAMAAGGPLAELGLRLRPCAGCVLCGMSRAFCALSHLRPAEALGFNPLVVLAYPLVVGLAISGPLLGALRPALAAFHRFRR